MNDEFEKCFQEYMKKSPKIIQRLLKNPNDEQAIKEAENLANNTHLTFSYEDHVCTDEEYPFVRWRLYIPRTVNLWARRADPLMKTFMFGAAEGHEKGCWECSWSC